jgi:hypothetical protein
MNKQVNEKTLLSEEEPPIMPYPSQPPPPSPPLISKMDIYHDPNVFAELDQIAINVRKLAKDQSLHSKFVDLNSIHF